MPKQTVNFPNDPKSERAFLAAIMLEPKIYKQVDVTIDDFFDEKHKKIYQCICELSEEGIGCDYVAVNAKVESKGWGQQIETSYIFSLGDEFPSAITREWKAYSTVIKKKSAARQLLALSQKMSF